MKQLDESNTSLRYLLEFSKVTKEIVGHVWQCILIKIVFPWLKQSGLTVEQLTIVGVHNRRGDFIKYSTKKMALATPKAILAAMDAMEDKFQHVYFVMVTDDISWAAKHVAKNKSNLFIASNMTRFFDFRVDLLLMSKCDHVLHSFTSSFGELAAYLAGGEEVVLNPNRKMTTSELAHNPEPYLCTFND